MNLQSKIPAKRKIESLKMFFAQLPLSLKVAAVLLLIVGVIAGFVYLEKFVKTNTDTYIRRGNVDFINPPAWISPELVGRLYTAAVSGGEDLTIREELAEVVRQNLETYTGWLTGAQVQTTVDSVRIRARWRKPIAVVELESQRFFLDADNVVVEFVEVPALPVVKIEGIRPAQDIPLPGRIWKKDDAAAAVEILAWLDKRDDLQRANRRLLFELARIDVSNFDGRVNKNNPHIVLYTADNTQIIWGAEIGKWSRHLEATDEQKIARLYGFYLSKGSLLGGVKNINLRDPQESVPLPIDKYLENEK